jgi:hypothetical protein
MWKGRCRVEAEGIAWGIGLVVIGGAITTTGYRFLNNKDQMADSYFQELSNTRFLFPRRRRLDEGMSPDNFRRMIGGSAVAFGMLFIAVGLLVLISWIVAG